MPDVTLEHNGHEAPPSATADRAQRAMLAKILAHLTDNWGPTSPQAVQAAQELAAFDEAARRRSYETRSPAQLLGTAAQLAQAARRRHQARAEALRDAQSGLTAAQERVTQAQMRLQATKAATTTARHDLAEAEHQVAKLELQTMPAAHLPAENPADRQQLLTVLHASLAATAESAPADHAAALASVIRGVEKLRDKEAAPATATGHDPPPTCPGAPSQRSPMPGEQRPGPEPYPPNSTPAAPAPAATTSAASHDATPAAAGVGVPTPPGGWLIGGPAAADGGADLPSGVGPATPTPGGDEQQKAAQPVAAPTQLDSPVRTPPTRSRSEKRAGAPPEHLAAGGPTPDARSRSGTARLRRKTTPGRSCV